MIPLASPSDAGRGSLHVRLDRKDKKRTSNSLVDYGEKCIRVVPPIWASKSPVFLSCLEGGYFFSRTAGQKKKTIEPGGRADVLRRFLSAVAGSIDVVEYNKTTGRGGIHQEPRRNRCVCSPI
jgi:hypothetical protein